MDGDRTPTQLLAEMILGEDLDEWVLRLRAQGLSWRRVAQRLEAATNGKVDITHETIRSWYPAERVAS